MIHMSHLIGRPPKGKFIISSLHYWLASHKQNTQSLNSGEWVQIPEALSVEEKCEIGFALNISLLAS